jgi:hypothetical protein
VADPDPKVAVLAVSGIVGGGLIGFLATESVLGPGLLATDDYDEKDLPGPFLTGVFAVGAVWLLWDAYKEAVKEVGWAPLLLGSGIVTVIGLARKG